MRYFMTIWALGRFLELEITETEFLDFKSAKKVLRAALSIEEKYEIIISNFLELEKDALSIAVDRVVRSSPSYSGFADDKLVYNRRIVNLLTSARLYQDQIKHNVKVCLPDYKKIGSIVGKKVPGTLLHY